MTQALTPTTTLPGTGLHDHPAILKRILDSYALPPHGTHGIRHWLRVMENGLRIARVTGGDEEVVALFGLFHDSRRINEYQDSGHGLRGGDFASELRGTLVHLSGDQFDRLHEACRLHTKGLITEDPTIGACWDADRLDLGRVGITPDPGLLCTSAARELIPWAHERARRDHDPRKD